MKMIKMGEMWTELGSVMATLMFVWAIFQQYFPRQLRDYLEKHAQKLMGFFNPYIVIKFYEYTGDRFKRSEVYTTIENYLSDKSSGKAKRLKADVAKDSQALVLSMDDHEEVFDDYNGVRLWWAASKRITQTQSFSFYPPADEKRYYMLRFHRKHREFVTSTYLRHVLHEGKAIAVSHRQRKLYTNNSSNDWHGYKKTKWSHVAFEHPATFRTLALDPIEKREILNDLLRFSKAKDYYDQIGKSWKRGYLLYGPPGTGKSTMIAAMANLLNYDVYDLELTTVKDNTELRRLLIETTNKAIIVIEDIDCSLALTGQRKEKEEQAEDKEEEKNPAEKMKKKKKEDDEGKSKVTLSGLLNFIDGLWSACGGERIFVFTTNYVEKLDPALIRRGRMDKHIEMSYCRFEAFKILAKNYLKIDSHNLFDQIGTMLEETDITPADVAEVLMPKEVGVGDEDVADTCLRNLIEAIEKAKEEAILKAENEAKLKAEKEAALEKEKEKGDDIVEEGKEKLLANGVKKNGHEE